MSTGWHKHSGSHLHPQVSLMTNPIWLIKTRLQLQQTPWDAAAAAGGTASTAAAPRQPVRVDSALIPYRGMVDATLRIAREEGLAGFYKGLGPSLLMVREGRGRRAGLGGQLWLAVSEEWWSS